MVARHSDAQKLREAKVIAKDFGLFVVEKPDYYLLYRAMPGRERSEFLGRRKEPADMYELVCKVTNVHGDSRKVCDDQLRPHQG